mmetsp:Transcript_38450/g.77351  ORF Transcript_38450/g.77351 Transcript_38450/m.77351 type:complete len:184 (-) Transcript_38450:313-864(-)
MTLQQAYSLLALHILAGLMVSVSTADSQAPSSTGTASSKCGGLCHSKVAANGDLLLLQERKGLVPKGLRPDDSHGPALLGARKAAARPASPSNAGVSKGPTVVPLKKQSEEEMTRVKDLREAAALNCKLSAWSDWSDCVQEHDGLKAYVRKRDRSVINPQLPGGRPCSELAQRRLCRSSKSAS